MRHLIVGDPHYTVDELKDCEKLMSLVLEQVRSGGVDSVILLGDLHHTHAITHVAATEFWIRSLRAVSAFVPTVVLLGNHDMPNGSYRGASGLDRPQSHALMPYAEVSTNIFIVDRPMTLWDMAFMPYVDSEEAFLSGVNLLKEESGAEVLFCHQTFNGAQYENGFFAKDGFSIEKVPMMQIISGHVHLPSQIDKVWYPGAPRWRTVSDANTERAIWVYDDVTQTRLPIDTGAVCSKIIHLKVEGGEVPLVPMDTKDRYYIDLHGTAEENSKAVQNPSLKGAAKIRRFDRTENSVKIKESEGVDKAFSVFMASFSGKNGTPGQTLLDLAYQRMGA